VSGRELNYFQLGRSIDLAEKLVDAEHRGVLQFSVSTLFAL